MLKKIEMMFYYGTKVLGWMVDVEYFSNWEDMIRNRGWIWLCYA